MTSLKDKIVSSYKKTAAVFGAALLAISGAPSAMAQQQPAPPATAMADSQFAAGAPTCPFKVGSDVMTAFEACSRLAKPVSFEDFDQLNSLVKKHPALADVVARYGMQNANGIIPDGGHFAQIDDSFVFYYDTADYCGSMGCMMMVFSPSQDGYVPSMQVVTADTPRFARRPDGSLSFFVATPDGFQREWALGPDGINYRPLAIPNDQTALPWNAPQSNKP